MFTKTKPNRQKKFFVNPEYNTLADFPISVAPDHVPRRRGGRPGRPARRRPGPGPGAPAGQGQGAAGPAPRRPAPHSAHGCQVYPEERAGFRRGAGLAVVATAGASYTAARRASDGASAQAGAGLYITFLFVYRLCQYFVRSRLTLNWTVG